MDVPLLQYTGATVGPANRQFLHANHQGSIIAASDSGGNAVYINTYDAYGVPGNSNQGRFSYTGQLYLAEIGLYHYRARVYNPEIGRFMQTDPIGYEDQINLYAYVHNDPMNYTDPLGMEGESNDPCEAKQDCWVFKQYFPDERKDKASDPDVTLTGDAAQQAVSDIQNSQGSEQGHRWTGTQSTIAAGAGGGAVRFKFNLESECSSGEKYNVEVVAGGFALMAGSPVSATYSRNVTFNDSAARLDPMVFSGSSKYAYVSYAFFGLGGSYQRIEAGGAVASGGGWQLGWDASVAGGAGISTVTSAAKGECE